MLRLKDVSKYYGEVAALEQLSLDIQSGSTTALIGPSGCGKSTLLRTLIGLVTPDSGVIDFNGVELNRQSQTQVRRQVGYVVQDSGLFPHLTARSNIELMARHLGWPDQQRETRILELAELTHFPRGCLDRFPTELSGGQNQRVGLMRALMLEPEVLLLDEPLGALDPMIRFELQEDLRAIFTTLKKTVVMVTHDLAEAAFLSDNIVLMRDGCIVQRGTLDDMLNSPANEFVTQFVRAQRNHHDDTAQSA